MVIVGSLIYSIRPTEKRDSDEPRNICRLLCQCCIGGNKQSSTIPQQFVSQCAIFLNENPYCSFDASYEK